MKVALVSPYDDDVEVHGLRMLSACLKQAGHDVMLIFLGQPFNREYDEAVLDELAELTEKAGLVGISLMTNFLHNAIQITERLQGVPVVWGGVHPTVRPEECLRYVDYVCVGDGEEALVELATALERGEPSDAIWGMWCKSGGKVVSNGVRRTADLDALPFLDYDGDGHFILHEGRIQPMSMGILHQYLNSCYRTSSSRGCPFSCTYCTNEHFNKSARQMGAKILRKRSVDNIVAECVWSREQYPLATWINFRDDAFFLREVEEVEEFARKYKEQVDIPFGIGGAHPQTLRRDKVALLVEAGLVWVRVGVQAASERIKKMYRRNYTNEQVLEAAAILKDFSPPIPMPSYDVILDNPWETDVEIIETVRLFMAFPTPYQINLFSLNFFPGTTLYQKALAEGIIQDEDVYEKDFRVPLDTPLNRIIQRLAKCTLEGDDAGILMLGEELKRYE
jgi:radical SAM superfamily enzyme YgiQ (UPF0313 family)